MQAACQAIANALREFLPAELGFVVLIFDYGERGAVQYIGTARRTDTIRVLREAIANLEKRGN